MISRNDFLSILGLYNYDESVFSGLVLPDTMDRESLIGNLCLECAELELIYPSLPAMKKAIEWWSTKELPVWEKLEETMHFDYNPIWNKDGKIVEDSKSTDSGSDHNSTDDAGTNTYGSTVAHNVSAFNETGYHNADQDVNGGQDSNTTHGDSTTSYGKINDYHYERIEQGNIGVTSTQELIERERAVDKFTVQDYIIESFKKRFCILVY